jgi:hypothetical protein
MAAALAVLIAGLSPASAGATPPKPADLNFSTAPSLFPSFRFDIRNYVVRCNDGPVTVNGHTSPQWKAKVANYPYLSGDFTEAVPLSTGQSFTIDARRVGTSKTYSFYVRCLPDDFPTYTYTRSGPVSPKYFSANNFKTSLDKRYGIIFDARGVPIWWIHAPAGDPRVLPNGDVLWFNRAATPNQWEIHRLDGSLVSTINTVGPNADPHDLQPTGNGDYLLGAYVRQSHVDTSAYGGSSDADVANAELQEVTPGGGLVWDWKSQDQIALSETGRYWPWAINHPVPAGYDILHWNSIEPDGGSVIASFRHLDAVYKIQKSTGNIAWKLGGTTTGRSLTVTNDKYSYTLGAQHDARLLPGGSLTVFDNRSNLGEPPRAERFRIDEKNRTAALLQAISDPSVKRSNCCGSARRLSNGDWLIDWGQNDPIGGYTAQGERTFLLKFDGNFSYRAEPVPDGAVSAQELRQAMDTMHSGP